MRNMKSVLAALATTTCIVALATPAYASEARDYNIEAGSLEAALDAFGRQSGEQVLYRVDDVKGKSSPGVSGKLSAEAALRKILQGTGLRVVNGAGGALAVTSGNAAAVQAEGRGTITGTVKDETSGAALKGALVELVGTGRTTSTDDLGAFRFANVRAGESTVRISYLGYMEQQSTLAVGSGETYAQDFTMIGGSGTREIVVYGSRSARAQALNQERTAENISTVVSSDLLGQFDGATISDALRRVPGVAFEQDAVTGDGANVVVRGLEPDFNTVTLNGLRLPEGSGTGRSPSLANILTDSISKITINKSLLPSMDSSGTGGLIEIETKGPLDRPRRYANFGIEGGRSAKGFTKDFSLNGTVSATFGAEENFGVSASIQYRKRNIQRYDYNVFNNGLFSYLPLDDGGNPIDSQFLIDPVRHFPFDEEGNAVYPDEVSTGYNGAKNRNLAVTLSAQAKFGSHTELRLDFVRSQTKRDEFTRTTSFNPFERYLLLPVDELGGEVRGVLVTDGAFSEFGIDGTFLTAKQSYEFKHNVKSVTDNLSLQGKTISGPIEANYTIGFSKGSSSTPLRGTANFGWRFNSAGQFLSSDNLADQAFDNVTSDGRAISLFRPLGGNAFPVPLLNTSGFQSLGDPSEWTLDPDSGATIATGDRGGNRRYTAKGDLKYDFSNSILKYVEIGGFFESARFSNAPILSDSRYGIFPANFGDLISISNLGLAFSGTSLSPIGINGGADVIEQADIENLFFNIDQVLASNSNLVRNIFAPTDARNQKSFTNENNFSFYVMPRLEVGQLEVIGGVRLDRVNIKTRSLFNPTLFGVNGVRDVSFETRYSELADGAAKQTTVLPRVAATWRVAEDFLVRGAFGISVARPQIQFQNGVQSVSFQLRPIFGPNGNQPQLLVSLANPDIKPAVTKNYDLSFEKYFQDVGQVKLSFFYKSIENLLGFAVADPSGSLDGVTIPDDPRLADLSGFFIQTTRPVNGDNPAEIYGLEVAVEKQFGFLPGALGGLGFYGNYTYTKGQRDQQTVFNNQNITRKVPISGAPKHSGTAALTYNKYGIDATLAYTVQGRRFDGFGDFGFDFYSEARSTLDFRAEYRFDPGPGQWRVWVEASDLMKGRKDADVISTQGGVNGVPKVYTGGNYYGGRRGSIGLSVNF